LLRAGVFYKMAYPPEDALEIKADIIKLTKRAYSMKDICFELCISKGIYFDWQKRDPEFKKALDEAKVYTSPTGLSASRRKLSLLSKSMKKLNGY
jgi:hypothetical protein